MSYFVSWLFFFLVLLICTAHFSSEFFQKFTLSLSFLMSYSSWFFDFKCSQYSFCLWACVFPISYKKKQKINLRKGTKQILWQIMECMLFISTLWTVIWNLISFVYGWHKYEKTSIKKSAIGINMKKTNVSILIP